MNKIILIGRVVRESELQKINDSIYLKNTIAVQRDFKNKDGNYDTDFFNFTIWGKQAEYLQKYCNKGDMISIIGKLLNRTYEKDGKKVTTNDIQVEEIKILTYHSKDKNNEELNRQVAENLGDDVVEFLD